MKTPAEIVENPVYDLATRLVDSDDTVTSRLAETNATGFGVDTCNVVEAAYSDANRTEIKFKAVIEYTGDQDPDRPYSGDALITTVVGVARCEDDDWDIVDYSVESCETNL